MTQTQTLLEAIEEVEQNVNELAELVEDESDDDTDDLPTFHGFDMEEELDTGTFVDFYIDGDGDLWLKDSEGTRFGMVWGSEVETIAEKAEGVR